MDGNDDKPTGSPPIQPPETVNSSNNSQKEKEDQVMSEIHLGCPPKFSGSFISHFTFSLPANVECVGSKCEYEAPNYSKHHLEVRLDDDGDLALPRRSKQSKDKLVVAIQHNITSSIPKVGLQVWRAELVLSDFVLHKMFTSTEFDGIVAVELGAGTGLVGMLLARAAKTVFLTDHGVEILENCAKNVHLNSAILRHKASVYVRELDWKASWPPRDDSCSSCQSYSWNVSEVKELENASLLVAADVIYSDDLTDALFTTLDQLMSQGSKKVLYLALEKRYNFSLDDLDVVANGYSQFRSYVRDESSKTLSCESIILSSVAIFKLDISIHTVKLEHNVLPNRSLCAFVGTRIDLSKIPQYVNNYDRGQDVELWEIKYTRKEENF